MDMEALFAEMRKAQTGGRDFAAEAAAAQEEADLQAAVERENNASDDDEANDASDDDDDDGGTGTNPMPPKGLTPSEEARLLRTSQAGRAAVAATKGGGGGSSYGSRDDFDKDGNKVQPSVEAARHRAIAALANKFEAACGHTLGGRWWSHYESWLYARRAAATAAATKASRKGGIGGGGVGSDSAAAAAAALDPVMPDPEMARSVGLSLPLPGVTGLVTWATLAVINCCLDHWVVYTSRPGVVTRTPGGCQIGYMEHTGAVSKSNLTKERE
jgi:hypothetical protein